MRIGDPSSDSRVGGLDPDFVHTNPLVTDRVRNPSCHRTRYIFPLVVIDQERLDRGMSAELSDLPNVVVSRVQSNSHCGVS